MNVSRYCPCCQAPLSANDDAPVHCGRCGGTWIPTMVAATYGALDFDVVTGEHLEAFGFQPECPTCSSTLRRRLLSGVGEVGACEHCGGLWTGPGRFYLLSRVLSGEARPSRVVLPEDPGSPLVWRAVMALSALSAAAAWALSARVL